MVVEELERAGFQVDVNESLYEMEEKEVSPRNIPKIMKKPSIGISLNFTNHLYDLPMLKTYINAYAPTRVCIRAAIEKAVGKSEFKGKHNDTLWCGRWDTKV